MADMVEDPWELIELKQYQSAIDEYTQRYKESGHDVDLYNRAIAYLLTKNYTAALEDYREAIAITEPSFQASSHYIGQGICLWYLNQPIQATEIWQQGLKAPYTDSAGGVELPALLLYASERLGDKQLENEVLSILKKFWQNHQRRAKRRQTRTKIVHSDIVYQGLFGWPGAIVPFLLEKADTQALMTAALGTGSRILDERQRCQANFYIALRALREADYKTFETAMTHCGHSTYGLLEHEYFLALWEMERGFPKKPFLSLNPG